MNEEEAWVEFYKVRQETFDAIKECLEEDGHCKSYEGRFEVDWPNYFDTQDDSVEGWNIHLACYLLGPHRGYDWSGKTFAEAVEKMTGDVRAFIKGDHEPYLERERKQQAEFDAACQWMDENHDRLVAEGSIIEFGFGAREMQ